MPGEDTAGCTTGPTSSQPGAGAACGSGRGPGHAARRDAAASRSPQCGPANLQQAPLSTAPAPATVTSAMCAPQQHWARHSSDDCILYVLTQRRVHTRNTPETRPRIPRQYHRCVPALHLLLLDPWPVPVRPPEMQTLRVILCRCGRAVAGAVAV